MCECGCLQLSAARLHPCIHFLWWSQNYYRLEQNMTVHHTWLPQMAWLVADSEIAIICPPSWPNLCPLHFTMYLGSPYSGRGHVSGDETNIRYIICSGLRPLLTVGRDQMAKCHCAIFGSLNCHDMENEHEHDHVLWPSAMPRRPERSVVRPDHLLNYLLDLARHVAWNLAATMQC